VYFEFKTTTPFKDIVSYWIIYSPYPQYSVHGFAFDRTENKLQASPHVENFCIRQWIQ